MNYDIETYGAVGAVYNRWPDDLDDIFINEYIASIKFFEQRIAHRLKQLHPEDFNEDDE